MSSRFSVSQPPTAFGIGIKTVKMEQTINFSAAQVSTQVTPAGEKARELAIVIKHWYNSKCEPMSRIAEFDVTWRVVILVNIVTLLLIVAAIAVAQAPLATLTGIAVAAFLTYRINHVKEGDRNE